MSTHRRTFAPHSTNGGFEALRAKMARIALEVITSRPIRGHSDCILFLVLRLGRKDVEIPTARFCGAPVLRHQRSEPRHPQLHVAGAGAVARGSWARRPRTLLRAARPATGRQDDDAADLGAGAHDRGPLRGGAALDGTRRAVLPRSRGRGADRRTPGRRTPLRAPPDPRGLSHAPRALPFLPGSHRPPRRSRLQAGGRERG